MLPKATALIANDPNYEFNLNYSIPRIAEKNQYIFSVCIFFILLQNFFQAMNSQSFYSIAFKGLSQGKHIFEYEIDDKFFAEFGIKSFFKNRKQSAAPGG